MTHQFIKWTILALFYTVLFQLHRSEKGNKGGIMIYLLLLVFIRNSAGDGDIFAYKINRAPVRDIFTLLNHVTE